MMDRLRLKHAAMAFLLISAPLFCQCTDIRVGFIGNSIIYFNDSPSLLMNMLKTKYDDAIQATCVRAQATLASIWHDGGLEYFGSSSSTTTTTTNATIDNQFPKTMLQSQPLDFVILQDQTQTPARWNYAMAVSRALKDLYAPLLLEQNVTPVFLQTFAYTRPQFGSEILGPYANFTRRLEHGYRRYRETLESCGIEGVRTAPVGNVFLWMHDHNYDMWSKLYGGDGVHPSPHGTLVLVCVLYVTITNDAPPRYDEQWWSFTNRGGRGGRVAPRRRQLPTKEEGEEIRKNVCEALGCNIDDES